MIPAWYAAAGMITTGLIGAVTTHLAGTGRRSRLLKRSTRIVGELRRLTSWTAPVQHWEAGMREDRWSLPVHARLTDRDRIAAAKKEALDGQDLPVQYGTRAEHDRRLELAAHSAPASAPDWHRNEHRPWTWGWCVELLARLASAGKTFVWKPEDHQPADPRHAAWNVDTQSLKTFVAEATVQETARRDRELDALLYSLVAKGAVLR